MLDMLVRLSGRFCRRGIEPIVAALILVVIAIAIGVTLFYILRGATGFMASSLGGSGSLVVSGQISDGVAVVSIKNNFPYTVTINSVEIREHGGSSVGSCSAGFSISAGDQWSGTCSINAQPGHRYVIVVTGQTETGQSVAAISEPVLAS